MLNSPKLIEEEKAKMASKERALKEKEGQKAANKSNNSAANGTGGTPIHVNTLQVKKKRHKTFRFFFMVYQLHSHYKSFTVVKITRISNIHKKKTRQMCKKAVKNEHNF